MQPIEQEHLHVQRMAIPYAAGPLMFSRLALGFCSIMAVAGLLTLLSASGETAGAGLGLLLLGALIGFMLAGT